MVYKLYEQHPDLLYIERQLQVMCFNLRCHPLWLPNYRNEKIHNEFASTRKTRLKTHCFLAGIVSQIYKDSTFHAVEMVYKLYEQHPDLLYIERQLQVMCFNLRCHPLWLPNYRNEKIHNEFDFTKDAYAVHFTQPLPKSFKSKDEMSKGKHFFANMARHVYGP